MKNTQRLLMCVFGAAIVTSLMLVVLFETDLLPVGILSGTGGSDEFVAATVMELATLCCVPVALRLFKFGKVGKALSDEQGLRRWGVVRLLMLCLPMVANTLLYYLYMNVAFGYMGIVLFLCLAFVVPTKARCESEISRLQN